MSCNTAEYGMSSAQLKWHVDLMDVCLGLKVGGLARASMHARVLDASRSSQPLSCLPTDWCDVSAWLPL